MKRILYIMIRILEPYHCKSSKQESLGWKIFFYMPLIIYKKNDLLPYLQIALQNIAMTIAHRGATDFDSPVAINIKRNGSYRLNQR